MQVPTLWPIHFLCRSLDVFSMGFGSGETAFRSMDAFLGEVEQMGVISDRPHTILRVDGVYFYDGARKYL